MAAEPDPHMAFAWMQARLVELLLRYDVARLGNLVGERASGPLDDLRLEPYRRLAALWQLRAELFEGVLPLIKRRLSFVAPRELHTEELPSRGRVDWTRTVAAGLRERPGEAPLEARTRQRRRQFATPENLLVVVTLLEYRAAAERTLESEHALGGAASLRHPLHEIVDACVREMAFPQLAGLVARCERIVAGDAEETVEDLERAVAECLPSGSSGAYEDLLAWRRKLAGLQLASRAAPPVPAVRLGADPRRDDLLYRTWLFFELMEFLRLRDGTMLDAAAGILRFPLGDGEQRQTYVLRLSPAQEARWAHGPPAAPGLLIERAGAAEVRDGEQLIWREPDYLVEARFGPEPGKGDAARRLLGDLQLADALRGAVVFAVVPGEDSVEPSLPALITPDQSLGATMPGTGIAVRQITPALDGRELTGALRGLLDDVHEALGQPVPVACHGVFLDDLSAADQGALATRGGIPLRAEPGDLLICPKPHIGPWRVDLVSRSRHCCQDPRLCHIVGQPGARRPVRPPRTTEDLLRELDQLFEARAPEELDEAAVDAVARRVEALTRRFAEVAGDFGDVTVYEGRLRDAGMDGTLHLLGQDERESLALAVYLVDKLDRVRATDFSAPTIHLARVLEREIQRRVMSVPGITPADFPHGKPTLGSLAGTRRRRPEVWSRIVAHLEEVWDGRVDSADPAFAVTLDGFVEQLQHMVHARNQAAHTTPVTRPRYTQLFSNLCHGGPLRVGTLNALLLAWRVGAEQ